MVSTYILWDIDGTLIRNTAKAGTLYLDSIEQVTGARPTVRVTSPHGMTEGQLLLAILAANDLPADLLPAVLLRLDELSKEQHEAGWVRERCPGVREAIAEVSANGWINALLTGNGVNRARYKLLAAGIDVDLFDWEHSFFGAHSPTRHHLTADAGATLAGSRAFIVGDTPKDGEAADSAGIPFIAVATGAYGADQLRPTSALVVIDDLISGLDDLLVAVNQSIGTASTLR